MLLLGKLVLQFLHAILYINCMDHKICITNVRPTISFSPLPPFPLSFPWKPYGLFNFLTFFFPSTSHSTFICFPVFSFPSLPSLGDLCLRKLWSSCVVLAAGPDCCMVENQQGFVERASHFPLHPFPHTIPSIPPPDKHHTISFIYYFHYAPPFSIIGNQNSFHHSPFLHVIIKFHGRLVIHKGSGWRSGLIPCI